MTTKTELTFTIDIREAQSLLLLMQEVNKTVQYKSRIIATYNFNDGNKQDFLTIKEVLENILLAPFADQLRN